MVVSAEFELSPDGLLGVLRSAYRRANLDGVTCDTCIPAHGDEIVQQKGGSPHPQRVETVTGLCGAARYELEILTGGTSRRNGASQIAVGFAAIVECGGEHAPVKLWRRAGIVRINLAAASAWRGQDEPATVGNVIGPSAWFTAHARTSGAHAGNHEGLGRYLMRARAELRHNCRQLLAA